MIYTIDNPKFVKDAFIFEGMTFFTGVVKDKYNNIAYYLNGKRHRVDGPAVILDNGNKSWYQKGKLHREDGPAIEWSDRKEWYLNDKLHREDAPAIEYANGQKEWFLNGQHHREDGPAIEFSNGGKLWYLNDKRYGSNDDYTDESWIRFIKLQLLK